MSTAAITAAGATGATTTPPFTGISFRSDQRFEDIANTVKGDVYWKMNIDTNSGLEIEDVSSTKKVVLRDTTGEVQMEKVRTGQGRAQWQQQVIQAKQLHSRMQGMICATNLEPTLSADTVRSSLSRVAPCRPAAPSLLRTPGTPALLLKR